MISCFVFLEFTEISKKVGIAWNNLSEEDKQVYKFNGNLNITVFLTNSENSLLAK